MPYEFSKIEDALQALAEGRVVIVVDDEERENEGDFIAAAERVTPETIKFMITHGRGQLCMPIMPEIANRLELHPMVELEHGPVPDAVHVPVDHKSCRTRHQRRGAGVDDPGDRRPGDQAGRPRPARAPLPARGQGRRRPPPRRAHRGDGRPGPAGGPDAGRRPLRDPRRHRHGRAASGCTRSPPSSTCRSSRSRC